MGYTIGAYNVSDIHIMVYVYLFCINAKAYII